ARWHQERLSAFGGSLPYRQFWKTLDGIAETFWRVCRRGASLPIRRPRQLIEGICAIGASDLGKTRYLHWSLGDLLRRHRLESDLRLRALLGMLVEDTVHGKVDTAPLINAALGITIRGAGLTRARGGMAGFWKLFLDRYRELGGVLVHRCRVKEVQRAGLDYVVRTTRGEVRAQQVVSALPAELTRGIGPPPVRDRLTDHVERNRSCVGGAVVVFLGVPEHEVADTEWTHHQLLHDYAAPLGMGNNMFLSVSSPNDELSAPPGHRAVMISTHCELDPWEDLDAEAYRRSKREAQERLIGLARRVYPNLGRDAVVCETGTPRTYRRFVGRPRGAVGGYRQSLANSNLRAIPHDLGVPGFHLVGDTTWPGLGTVACVLGSRVVASNVMRSARVGPA
ncbi:MAG: FAD-dependent oxidoreductase, partial [Planctomycetota bacterium]